MGLVHLALDPEENVKESHKNSGTIECSSGEGGKTNAVTEISAALKNVKNKEEVSKPVEPAMNKEN